MPGRGDGKRAEWPGGGDEIPVTPSSAFFGCHFRLPGPLHLNSSSPFSPRRSLNPTSASFPRSFSHHLMYDILYRCASPTRMWPPWGQGRLSLVATIVVPHTEQCLALSRCSTDAWMIEQVHKPSSQVARQPRWKSTEAFHRWHASPASVCLSKKKEDFVVILGHARKLVFLYLPLTCGSHITWPGA